jgi:hypothetical protein
MFMVCSMTDATATAERREEILGELAEWMHAAAREAQRRLLEAETTDDFLDLALDDLIAQLCRDLGFEPPAAAPHTEAPEAAAAEPVAEVAGSSPGAPAVHAPNTS